METALARQGHLRANQEHIAELDARTHKLAAASLAQLFPSSTIDRESAKKLVDRLYKLPRIDISGAAELATKDSGTMIVLGKHLSQH